MWLLSLSSSSSKVAAAAVPRSSADAVVVRPVNSFSIFFFFVERLTKVETGKKTLKTLNTKSLFLFSLFFPPVDAITFYFYREIDIETQRDRHVGSVFLVVELSLRRSTVCLVVARLLFCIFVVCDDDNDERRVFFFVFVLFPKKWINTSAARGRRSGDR